MTKVLRKMEFVSQLLYNLIKLYPSRMQAVVQAGKGHKNTYYSLRNVSKYLF